MPKNREIKFRAKHIHGEWVYGYFFRDKNGQATIMEFDGDTCHEVDEKTVGEFTGLKDKNGKEIYEGDIINSENNCVAKVRFNDGRFEIEFLPQKGFKGRIDDLCYAVEMKVEIIGSIYENPELLK